MPVTQLSLNRVAVEQREKMRRTAERLRISGQNVVILTVWTAFVGLTQETLLHANLLRSFAVNEIFQVRVHLTIKQNRIVYPPVIGSYGEGVNKNRLLISRFP